MALLFRCLMEVRAVIGEVDPPPLPGIGASTSSRRLEWLQAVFPRRFALHVAPPSGGHERSGATPHRLQACA